MEWAFWAIYRLRRGRGKASADLFWKDGYRCVCGEKISYVRVYTRVGFIDWKVQCPRPMTQERHTLVNV